MRATHRYNNRSQSQQGARVQTTAQKIEVIVKNLQVQHQSNVVIDTTTGVSLGYSNTIKGIKKLLGKINLQMKFSGYRKEYKQECHQEPT